MERHEEAERAEQGGDPERAIDLYERSVAENFVGSQPYERLASLYERRHDHAEALRVCEAFLQLAPAAVCPSVPNAPPTANSPISRPASTATETSRKNDSI